MKDVFEATKSDLCKTWKQNELLKDQLLETNLKHEIECCVLLSHECVDNNIKDEIEKVQRDSIEIQEGMQKRINILENDVQRCQKQIEKLESENVCLEFQVQSLIKEQENVTTEYQKLFDSIKKTRAQTQGEINELFENFKQKTHAYADVRAQNQDLLSTISELKAKLKTVENGLSATSSVRRPSNRDSSFKNTKNVLCVTCAKNVLILCHDNYLAKYKLNARSKVRRALFTTPGTVKSTFKDTTPVVSKTRDKWCKWVDSCLRSASMSILVNGSPSEEFRLKRGIRQGDPLSHFLFILAAEGLNALVSEAVEKGIFRGVAVGEDNVTVSHLQYADDTIFFEEWNKENAKSLMCILKCFEEDSGLRVNYNKSKIYGIGVNEGEMSDMARWMRCEIGEFPFTYLGLPIRENMKRVNAWYLVVEKFKKRLASWKTKTMSFAGRLTLVKSVLGSLQLYYFLIFRGLNVGSLRAKNLPLLGKWWWRFRKEGGCLWVRVIKSIHGDSGELGDLRAMEGGVKGWGLGQYCQDWRKETSVMDKGGWVNNSWVWKWDRDRWRWSLGEDGEFNVK
ncbi:reverse transcriptase domain, reverse transcriptase zinc-binding domain protein [Tanacetum coccineum]